MQLAILGRKAASGRLKKIYLVEKQQPAWHVRKKPPLAFVPFSNLSFKKQFASPLPLPVWQGPPLLTCFTHARIRNNNDPLRTYVTNQISLRDHILIWRDGWWLLQWYGAKHYVCKWYARSHTACASVQIVRRESVAEQIVTYEITVARLTEARRWAFVSTVNLGFLT